MPIQHQNIIKVLSIDAVVKTTAFTALAGKSYLVSATAASVVVTPPATPAVDDLFAVQDATAGATGNTITIDFATAKINSAADSYVMNDSTTGNAVTFRYVNATVGWMIESASES